jgi:hypothetical protein
MAGPFFQHLRDAQQIGDLAGRQVFLHQHPAKQSVPLSLPDQEEAPKAKAVSTSRVSGMRLLL